MQHRWTLRPGQGDSASLHQLLRESTPCRIIDHGVMCPWPWLALRSTELKVFTQPQRMLQGGMVYTHGRGAHCQKRHRVCGGVCRVLRGLKIKTLRWLCNRQRSLRPGREHGRFFLHHHTSKRHMKRPWIEWSLSLTDRSSHGRRESSAAASVVAAVPSVMRTELCTAVSC